MPEPTEEEMLKNEIYLEELAKKRKRRNIYIAAAVFGATILISISSIIAIYGYKNVKDTVFGYPTKELLEGEWVLSTYGFPPISIETPQVLLRQNASLPPEIAETINDIQLFSQGSYADLFSVSVSATIFKEQNETEFQKAVEFNLAAFEANGIKNIIPKQEEFVTKSEVKGLKTYGSGQFDNPAFNKKKKISYIMLHFGGKGFMQQVIITWEEGDAYAEKIVERILASVDVNTQT